MGNTAIVFPNQVDGALITASSQALTMPATNILTEHLLERWRSENNSDFFVCDKGSNSLGDSVLVGGLTGGVNSTFQLRLSSADSSGAAGDVLDTGALATGSLNYDVNYGQFAALLSTPKAYRYIRCDIYDPDKTYVEAGGLCSGLRTTLDYNFVPGASVGWVDRSKSAPTAGGQTLIWPDNNYRQATLSFEFVSAAQRISVFEPLDRDAGQRKNVLLIMNPDGTNLAFESIFGLMTNLTPVTQPNLVFFAKVISIAQRL